MDLPIRGWWLGVFGCLAVACTERQRTALPEPREQRRDAVASSSSQAPTAPAAQASPSERPPADAPSAAAALPGALGARAERWKKRIFYRSLKDVPGAAASIDAIQLAVTHHGAFDVIVASVPTPVMAGGAEDTHEMLVVTKDGELELRNAPDVVGRADLNGDGRDDLVLKDVTVIADMANGPLVLPIGAKGGAYGWREVRIAARDGKPALVATTETNTSREVGYLRAGGYLAHESKGILEEVTLQWNGQALAAVGRKPIETAAQAEARRRQFAEETRQEEARLAESRRACAKACPGECAASDGGAGCLAECRSRCNP